MLGNYRLYTQCVWGSIHSGANMPVMSHEALMSWGPLHSNPIIIEDDERVTSGRGIDGWTSDLDWSRGVFEDELGSRLQTSENCSKVKNYCWKGVDLYSKFSWRIKENITVILFFFREWRFISYCFKRDSNNTTNVVMVYTFWLSGTL